MGKKHWFWWMSLAALALAVVLLFPGSVRAEAREYKASGTVYASRIPDNAKVVLTGNTSIIINTDKTVTCITGQNYDLILSRDPDFPNATLTLANFREEQIYNIIDVNTFTTNASVAVKGTFIAAQSFYGVGIRTQKWIQVEAMATVDTSFLSTGLSAGTTINIRGTVDVNPVEAGGKITVDGGKLKVYGRIQTKEDFNLARGSVESSNSSQEGISAGGSISISGDLTVKDARKQALYTKTGDISVYGTVSCISKESSAIECRHLQVMSSGVISKAAGAKYGISAEEMIVQGEVNTSGAEYGIYVQRLISQGKIDAYSNDGIGIYTRGMKFEVKSGILHAKGNIQAVKYWDQYPLELASTMIVYSPIGALPDRTTILDVNGEVAKDVKIAAGKPLTGSVTLSPDYLDAGETIIATGTGVPNDGYQSLTWQSNLNDITKKPEWKEVYSKEYWKYPTPVDAPWQHVRLIVAVEGYGGRLISNEAAVMPVYPTIITQPEDASAYPDEPMTFKVEAKNVETYQWVLYTKDQKQADMLNKNTAFWTVKGQGTDTLVLTPLNDDLNGMYVACDLTSSAGKGKRTRYAAITVKDGSLKKGDKFVKSGIVYQYTGRVHGDHVVAVTGAFRKSITKLTIPATVKYRGVSYTVYSIADEAFAKKTSLKKVVIGEYVTKIGKKAFENCKALQTVTFGENVKTIGESAFFQCVKLKTVKFGAALKTIETQAFWGCTGLKKVTMKNSVTTIGDRAFAECKNLTNVVWSTSLKKFGKGAFQFCSSLKEATLGSKVTAVGESAFNGCSGLKTLSVITKNLMNNNVGKYAFSSTPDSLRVLVPDGKLESYKKLLIKKGVSKKATFSVPKGSLPTTVLRALLLQPHAALIA